MKLTEHDEKQIEALKNELEFEKKEIQRLNNFIRNNWYTKEVERLNNIIDKAIEYLKLFDDNSTLIDHSIIKGALNYLTRK